MRIAVAIAIVVITGCGTAARPEAPGRAQRPAAKHAASPSAKRAGQPPAADAPFPSTAPALANALAETTHAAEVDARAWLRTKPAAGAMPPESLALRALYQQRIYRYLRRRPATAAKVVAALPASLRPQARDNIGAGRSLLELSPKRRPKTQPPIRVGTAEAPQRLLAWYRAAQRRFGVRWELLAAINLVESDFNRLQNASYAGAQGPMQFMPATWSAYGLGGDIHDPRDAIMGAANYLHASGAPASDRTALYHYNPSRLYIDAVMRYARQMQRRGERFYVYWNWQVFVRDWKHGTDKRLTGPGL